MILGAKTKTKVIYCTSSEKVKADASGLRAKEKFDDSAEMKEWKATGFDKNKKEANEG
ncbi:MAG: hypothetical protein QXM06_03795 [Archaeoglobaceae archaeon]